MKSVPCSQGMFKIHQKVGQFYMEFCDIQTNRHEVISIFQGLCIADQQKSSLKQNSILIIKGTFIDDID